MNGQSYCCEARGDTFTIQFARVKSGPREFPVTFFDSTRSAEGADVITKNGKLKHQSTNGGQALAHDKKGHLFRKRAGIGPAKCQPAQ